MKTRNSICKKCCLRISPKNILSWELLANLALPVAVLWGGVIVGRNKGTNNLGVVSDCRLWFTFHLSIKTLF